MGNAETDRIHQQSKLPEVWHTEAKTFDSGLAYLPNIYSHKIQETASHESVSEISLLQAVPDPQKVCGKKVKSLLPKVSYSFENSSSIKNLGIVNTENTGKAQLDISELSLQNAHVKSRECKYHERAKKISNDQFLKTLSYVEPIPEKNSEYSKNELWPVNVSGERISIDLYSCAESESYLRTARSFDKDEGIRISNYTSISELSGDGRKNLSISRSDVHRGSDSALFSGIQDTSSDESVKHYNYLNCVPHTSSSFDWGIPQSTDSQKPVKIIEFTPKFFSCSAVLGMKPAKKQFKPIRTQRASPVCVKIDRQTLLFQQIIKTD